MAYVRNFLANSCLNHKVNKTTIVLIPKKTSTSRLTDFRPISFCTVQYKFLAKVLVHLLRPLMSKWYISNQVTFVPSRSASHNVITAKEVASMMGQSHRKKKFCAIKLDIQRAHNTMSWNFLENCLTNLGFHQAFIKLIMTCVSTVTYRVKINVTLSPPNIPQCGLRQGDPLAPYLYMMYGEALHSATTYQNNRQTRSPIRNSVQRRHVWVS